MEKMELNLVEIEGIIQILYNGLPFKLKDVHNKLQNQIDDLSEKFNLSSKKEYPIYSYWKNKKGRIDVVWINNKEPVVAFEIDSRFRSKSLRKLLSLRVEYRIWFYYGYRVIDDEVKKIDPKAQILFIDLRKGIRKNIVMPTQSNAKIPSTDNKKLVKKTYSVSTIREKYPHAYLPWSKEDDMELQLLKKDGMNINQLAKYFNRQTSAIRSRLRKLRLLDE